MSNQSTIIKVYIREHRTDVLDEEGTVRRTAMVATRADAQRWLKRELPRVSPEFEAVGEATEYEGDEYYYEGIVAFAVWDDDQLDWFAY